MNFLGQGVDVLLAISSLDVEEGGKGEEMIVMANMYPMTEGNETEVVKVETVFPVDNFKNVNTPVSKELVVKRN